MYTTIGCIKNTKSWNLTLGCSNSHYAHPIHDGKCKIYSNNELWCLRVLYLFLIASVNKLCTEKLVHLLKTSEILDEFQNFFFKQSLIDKCSNRECLTKHDGAPKLRSIFRFNVSTYVILSTRAGESPMETSRGLYRTHQINPAQHNRANW